MSDDKKIEIFHGGKDYTPEQLILEMLGFKDDIRSVAVVIEWNHEDGEPIDEDDTGPLRPAGRAPTGIRSTQCTGSAWIK